MFRSLILAVGFAVTSGASLWAATVQTSAGAVQIDRMVSGLDTPWGFGFLPGGGILITERGGNLRLVKDGKVQNLRGVPRVAADGQGGLLDVLVPRDFAQSREIFLTLAHPNGRRASTAVFKGRLSDDGSRLENGRIIFAGSDPTRSGRHFGSRLVEAPDGHLFLTIGDRGDRPSAQDTANHNGTVLRLSRDGAPAPGNPGFEQPEIWSFGHRNPQGAALDGAGQLWVVEHGARGGDEVNQVEKGANYGWPVIAYGRHYSGAKIGEGTAKDGMAQPAHFWDPSIAPSGMMIYQGDMFPQWRGDIFVGSLKFDFISRLDGDPLKEREQIQSDETSRVRDIREGPDGSIWFLSVGDGALYRVSR